MIQYYSLLVICLGIGSLRPTKSLIIDDFTRAGLTNNIGFQRTVRKPGDLKNGSYSIRYKGTVSEALGRTSGYMDVNKKIIRITYSYTREYPWRLIIVQPDKKWESIKLPLELEDRRQIVVPMTEFRSVNLSTIAKVIVVGEMLLHCIELIDDPNFISWNPAAFTPPSSNSHLSPVLLIDDFSQWSDPSTNTLLRERHVPETAITVPGSVSLLNESDHLTQFFTTKSSPMNMQYMAFRITYSITAPQKNSIGLLHTADTRIENVPTCDIDFPAGSSLELKVPVSTLMQCVSQRNENNGHGVVIYGPLAIHRIELIMNESEKRDMLSVPTDQGPALKAINYSEKCGYFHNALQLITIPSSCQMLLTRSNFFEEAFNNMNIYSFRMDLDVFFNYFPRRDGRSSKRMFFDSMQIAISAPETGLFERLHDRRRSLRIIPKVNIDPDRLKYYKFVGQMLGMGIIHRALRAVNFVPTVYKILLDAPLDVSDLDTIDPMIIQDVQAQIANANLDSKVITMSVTHINLVTNQKVVSDLIPSGRNIIVDRENRLQYAAAYCKWHADRLIGFQGHALREGFYEVIPKTLFKGFSGDDLEYIMNGRRGHNSLPI